MTDLAGGFPRPLREPERAGRGGGKASPTSTRAASRSSPPGEDTLWGSAYKFPARGSATNTSDTSDIGSTAGDGDNMTNFSNGRISES